MNYLIIFFISKLQKIKCKQFKKITIIKYKQIAKNKIFNYI